MATREEVLIVGGGLAGLACAGALEARGIPFRLFEASDRIGGRVRTDEVDGFRLDRGFQVHFPAYPNASKVLAHADLDLRPWRNGAQIWDGSCLRTVDRDRPFRTLRDGALGLADLTWLGLLTLKAVRKSVEEIRDLPDRTTEAELRTLGFSETAFRRFFRPFFGGVFVDPPLNVSRRQFLFVHKMLQLAPASLPNAGMEAIPHALAACFPTERISVGTAVDEILRAPDGTVNGVRVGIERVPASHVIVATDADVAERLTGVGLSRPWLGSVALYFESEKPVVDDRYIVLNGTGTGCVNEVVPVTNAAPGYAPAGRHLLCAVVLGNPPDADSALVERVTQEVQDWFPSCRALRFIRLYRIPKHQLSQAPGFDIAPPNAPKGLTIAGEVTTNCSIDGAIASGIRAAERVTP